MNNLIKRTITGAVFVTAIVASILFQKTCYSFTALFAIVNILALKEFYGIVNKKQNVSVPTVYMIICGTVLYLGVFWCAIIDKPTELTGFLFLILYMLLIATLIIMEIFRKREHPTYDLAFSIYGQVVVALPLALLNFIAREPISDLLPLFILIWTFDSGAYIVGCSIGKHHMIERISPKKTWEGEFGGIVLTAAIATAIAFYLDQPVWQWIIYSLIVSVFGTFGDLSESMLKRASGLKDSGNILPGHGGMLDRFDSLLLAAPIIYIYIEILKAF